MLPGLLPVFAYCKQSITRQWEGLRTRLLPPTWLLVVECTWLLVLDRNTSVWVTAHAVIRMHEWLLNLTAGREYFGIMLGQCIRHVDVHLHFSHTTSTAMFLQSSFIHLYYVNIDQLKCVKMYTPHKFYHMQYICIQCTQSVCEGSISSVSENNLPHGST